MSFATFSFPRPPPPDGWAAARASAPSMPWADPQDFAPLELERLAHACLQGLSPALALVEGWRRAGHGLEDIYLRAIAPCARVLGHWWCCDEAGFAQVTIASANLQRLLQHHSAEFCAPGADRPAGLSLLLATEPQAQHTMGAFMLSEFFRRHGWAVQLLTPHDGAELLAHLRRDWFDAIGLSVSTGRELQALGRLVPRLRAESPNPQLRVLVGGPAVQHAEPEALDRLGVDLVGGDARDTVWRIGRQVTDRRS